MSPRDFQKFSRIFWKFEFSRIYLNQNSLQNIGFFLARFQGRYVELHKILTVLNFVIFRPEESF